MSAATRKENGSSVSFKGCACKTRIDAVTPHYHTAWIPHIAYPTISVLKDFIKSDGNIVIVDVKALADNEVLPVLSGRRVVSIDRTPI